MVKNVDHNFASLFRILSRGKNFVLFCCSVVRTKTYKKYYKMDHVALYQYVVGGPGPQKTKCRSGPGSTRSCEIWKKKGTNLQFYHITFLSARPQSSTPFLITSTFHVCSSSIYKFKFTSFLIFAIYYRAIHKEVWDLIITNASTIVLAILVFLWKKLTLQKTF